MEVILPVADDLWKRTPEVSLLPWLQVRNGGDGAGDVIGFVLAANDSLRWIEFIHNYEVPADLFIDVDPFIFADGFESGDCGAWQELMRYLQARRGG